MGKKTVIEYVYDEYNRVIKETIIESEEDDAAERKMSFTGFSDGGDTIYNVTDCSLNAELTDALNTAFEKESRR